MRFQKSLLGSGLVAAVLSVAVAVAHPRREPAEMESMLAKIATYQYGDSRVVQAELIQYIQDSLSSPAMVKQIEARLLSQVMPLAKQAAEKRLVLSRLAGYPCKESLDLAQASLNRCGSRQRSAGRRGSHQPIHEPPPPMTK